jgi:hypothetical protein
LKKLSRIPCSSTVVTDSWKRESGEAFLLETLAILFQSRHFKTDLSNGFHIVRGGERPGFLWCRKKGNREAWSEFEALAKRASMTWHRYQVGENKIMFYDKDGHRPFRVAPFDAWDLQR